MSGPPRDLVARPARVAAAAATSVGIGALIATQVRVNGELGERLGDGFTTAAISFGTGLVVATILLLLAPGGPRGLGSLLRSVRAGTIPWWYLAGGVAGAAFVLGQGLLGGVLGVALFTIGLVAGQTLSSMLVDRRGLGTMPPRRVTPQRLAGAVLAVAAVAVAGSGELPTALPVVLVLVPVGIGLLTGVQPALNGQVRFAAGSAAAATFVNFAIGAAILVVAALVRAGFAGWPAVFPAVPWLYLGGVVGVLFVAAQTLVVRTLGALLMGLGMLAGQLVAAVVFDLVVPLQGSRLTPVTLIGAAVTLIAVGVAAVPARLGAERLRARTGTSSR